MSLKYLFTATYADGSTLEQNVDDKSKFEPEKRSAFFDALRIGEQKKMTRFELKGQGHAYAVDLNDGHFEVDGIAFRMHEEALEGFELIFFRQHTHTFRVVDKKELAHNIVYRLGWKLKGNQTYQRVMQID